MTPSSSGKITPNAIGNSLKPPMSKAHLGFAPNDFGPGIPPNLLHPGFMGPYVGGGRPPMPPMVKKNKK